jgi:DNA-binding MarR family transcriptional regulator
MSNRRLPTAVGSAHEPPAFLASPGFLLARVGAESRRRFARVLAQSGMAVSHYGLLTVLAANGPKSQRDLAKTIGIDPRNLVSILDNLEARRFVERRSLKGDRRVRSVSLSVKGQRTLERIQRKAEEIEGEFLAVLTAAERENLHAILLKLFNAIDSDTD